MKVCRCTSFAFTDARVEVMAGGSIPGPVWVCNRCGNVHHAFQPVEDDMRLGPRNAVGPLGSVGNDLGQWVTNWAVSDGFVKIVEFRTYPRIIPMSERKPLIFTIWDLLQSKVAVILAEPEGPSDNAIEADRRERAKQEARGIAEALAILMKPFMDPPEGANKSAADMVVSHAVKYFKNNDHEVPGLGAHLWDPHMNADGTPRTVIAEPKSRPKAGVAKKQTAASTNKRKLEPSEVDGIKEALLSGMFTEEDIASMFKVSIETLREAVSA